MRFLVTLLALLAASCLQPAPVGPLFQAMGLAPVQEDPRAAPFALSNLAGEKVDLASLRSRLAAL